MERTIALHMDLIEALVGPDHAKHCPLDLRIMGTLHAQSDDDRTAIQRFVTACLAQRATYCLTVQDIVQRFHVSARQVQRLAQSGALNGSRIGGRWVFTEAQLDRYLKANTYEGGTRARPEGADWLARSDAPLLKRARAALGDDAAQRAGLHLQWTIRHLANALPIGDNDAYLLVLKWHSYGLVE